MAVSNKPMGRKSKPAPAADTPRYIVPSKSYIDGRRYEAGEIAAYAGKPGKGWVQVDSAGNPVKAGK